MNFVSYNYTPICFLICSNFHKFRGNSIADLSIFKFKDLAYRICVPFIHDMYVCLDMGDNLYIFSKNKIPLNSFHSVTKTNCSYLGIFQDYKVYKTSYVDSRAFRNHNTYLAPYVLN